MNQNQQQQPQQQPLDDDDDAFDAINTGSDDEISYGDAPDDAPAPTTIDDPNIAPIKIDEQMGIDEQKEQQYVPRTGRSNLRARKPRDYGHLHTTLEHTSMTQYMERGIKEFGRTACKP